MPGVHPAPLLGTKAGYAYNIVLDVRQGSGLYGSLSIVAFERAPDGTTTPIRPTRNPGEIQECLRWGNDNQPL
jgi:hypothetical protein